MQIKTDENIKQHIENQKVLFLYNIDLQKDISN